MSTRHTLYTALAALGSALALAACAPQSPDAKPFVVADLFATPGKALATLALSPTPEPSATVPNLPSPTFAPTLPLPTVVVLSQPTLPIGTYGPTPTLSGAVVATPPPPPSQNCVDPPMPFTPVWQVDAAVRDALGCPSGGAQQVAGVFQFYEHGVMFWRQSDKSIFVLSDLAIQQGNATDHWWRFDDTWREGDPESDPGLSPPGDLKQPVRGFGKVWRSNGFIRDALGWATTDELPITSTWQQFEKGWMMTGPADNLIYALIPLDAPPYSTGLHYGALP
jgi:hypothetical protein